MFCYWNTKTTDAMGFRENSSLACMNKVRSCEPLKLDRVLFWMKDWVLHGFHTSTQIFLKLRSKKPEIIIMRKKWLWNISYVVLKFKGGKKDTSFTALIVFWTELVFICHQNLQIFLFLWSHEDVFLSENTC